MTSPQPAFTRAAHWDIWCVTAARPTFAARRSCESMFRHEPWQRLVYSDTCQQQMGAKILACSTQSWSAQNRAALQPGGLVKPALIHHANN
jgi:hypothetical protein